MLAPNSILRRLPAEIDRKQLLFFDGMRHAAEIVAFAYSRLQATLTRIALSEKPEEVGPDFTAAFLDAWAVVDAIDRFRALWALVPGMVRVSPPNGEPTFEQITRPVRDLRNVSDHLAQRADYVVARRGTALGVLSWYTALRPDGHEGYICTITPGTVQSGSHRTLNPGGRIGEYPTSMIELAAGEYRACLSDVLSIMEARIRQIESSIETSLADLGIAGRQAGTDLLVRLHIEAKNPGSGQNVSGGDGTGDRA